MSLSAIPDVRAIGTSTQGVRTPPFAIPFASNSSGTRGGDNDSFFPEITPDGRYVVAMRADLRNVPLRPVVTEFAPKDAPFAIVHMDRYPITADEIAPARTITAIDVRTAASVTADVDSARLQDYAPIYFASGVVWWNVPTQEVYFITGTRDATRYGLAAFDLRTGKTRTVIEETEPHYYSLNPYDYARPNVHVLRGGAEAIWYSQPICTN